LEELELLREEALTLLAAFAKVLPAAVWVETFCLAAFAAAARSIEESVLLEKR